MSEDLAVRLAEADRGTLVAPAGHGKTWTLARAVRHAASPQLVLTHTHAGVQALRRQLVSAGVSTTDVEVETIAGYAMKWATHYPGVSGWSSDDADPDWGSLHPAALSVLSVPSLLKTVDRSYGGLFVDEYQDCSLDQHALVRQLATVLPTRLIGDPLQGIYNFPGSPAVDFDTDVWPEFPPMGGLDTPWRWVGSPALAADLQQLRQELLSGVVPDLATYDSIRVVGPHPAGLPTVCKDLAEGSGTVAVLRATPNQAHSTTSRLGGRYVSMEEVEGRDIIDAAQALEATVGPPRAAALLNVLAQCTTKIVPALRAVGVTYDDGTVARVPRGKLRELVAALNQVAETTDLTAASHAIGLACNHPGAFVYRPEVPQTLREAIQIHQRATPPLALTAAVRLARRQQRGQALPRRVVSRTRLVKGLQFDHVVVCDTQAFDASNLYVALTRGGTSVTVVTT